MIVITTPTGQIGSQTVSRLLDRGEPVRVIVRDPSRLAPGLAGRVEAVAGSHGDPAVLDRALAGADALLWLVPTSLDSRSTRDFYVDFTRPAAQAIRAQGLSHVLGVSTAGHGWERPAGLLSAAFAMDAELESSGAAYRALSMPFFMENLLRQVDAIAEHGTVTLGNDPERVLPLVATRDVAELAAGLLADRSWSGQENLPVFSPDRLTPVAIAEIIGDVVGREVTYTRVAAADIARGMAERGASEGVAQDFAAMTAAVDAGIYDADLAAADPMPTGFRAWCEEVLAPAVAATGR